MAITVFYRMQPERLDFAAEPDEARRRALECADVASSMLLRAGIDFKKSKLKADDGECRISVTPVGAGFGCESLSFGWNLVLRHDPADGRVHNAIDGQRWCKTQYARDYLRTHVAVCHILASLQDHGLVSTILDEGEYLPHYSMERAAYYGDVLRDPASGELRSALLRDPASGELITGPPPASEPEPSADFYARPAVARLQDAIARISRMEDLGQLRRVADRRRA